MKKSLIRTASLLFVLILVFAASGTAAFADGTITANIPVTYQQSSARSMLSLINELRQPGNAWYLNEDGSRYEPADLPPLSYDYALEQIAMQRAAELVLKFGHTRPNGTNCFTASYGGVSSWGENIAYNYSSTPNDAFVMWSEEYEDYYNQGHRRNMLSGGFTAVGIACACCQGCYFWVQEFGYSVSGAGDPGAVDGAAEVPVEVLADGAQVSAQLQGDASVTMTYGDTAAAPAAILTMSIDGFLFSSSEPSVPDWTVEDGSVVSVADGMLTALKTGSTRLVNAGYGLSVEVTVVPRSLAGASVELPTPQSFTGSELTPEPVVTLDGVQLAAGTDYDVRYSSAGKGNYTGTAQGGFEIIQCAHQWDGGFVSEKEPSCSEKGTEKRTCTKCGYVEVRDVDMLPHTPEEISAVAPTCTQAGSGTGTRCSVCGAVLSQPAPVPALGHSWDPDTEQVTQEATCAAEGSASHSCSVCGAEETYALPVKPHTAVTDPAAAATCTAEGRTEGSHCAVCGAVLTAQKAVPAAGHQWKDQQIITAATCASEGSAIRVCGRCGAEETYSLAKTGHSFGSWYVTKEASAQSAGKTERICSRCGVCETKEFPLGTISKEAISGKNALETDFAGDKETVMGAVLTEAERKLPGLGKNLSVRLIAEEAGTAVPSADRQLAEAVEGYKIAQYINVSLEKEIDGKTEEVSHTASPVRITFTVPSALKGKDEREFAVIRVHDGAAVVLEDLDSAAETVTVETDCFSTFALAYTAEERLCTVRFNANGGTCRVQTREIPADSPLTYLPVPVMEGMSFAGWYTQPDGGEEVSLGTVFSGDTELYARWTSSEADAPAEHSAPGTLLLVIALLLLAMVPAATLALKRARGLLR